MEIGISSMIFIDRGIVECLERVASQFTRIELSSDGAHSLPKIEKELKALMPSYQLTFSVHAPFSDINIASTNAMVRELSVKQIEETLRAAARLGIQLVTIHPGSISPSTFMKPAEVWRLNLESIAHLAAVADDCGVCLALENMPNMNHLLCRAPSEIVGILDNVAHGLGITFDVGHASTNNNVDEFLQYADKFVNVHLHDNNGEKYKDPHLVLGEGAIDFQSVLKALLPKYSGGFIIESRTFEDGVKSKNVLETLLQKL